MSVVLEVQKKINEITSGLFATWMPDDRTTLGEYGLVEKGRFLREGDLKRKGISIAPHVQSWAKGSFKYKDGVSISVLGSLEAEEKVTLSGSAKAEVTFTKEGAFLYHSEGAQHQKIDNRDEVFSALIDKVVSGELVWKEEYVLVDEVVACDHSTIIVSDGKKAVVGISTDGKLLESDNFANASANLEFDIRGQSLLDFSGAMNTSPLYNAVRLKFPDNPNGGGGSGISLFEKIKSILGISYPKPREIDISPYKKGDAFLVTSHETGSTMVVEIKSLTIEDMLSEDPEAQKQEPIEVETINLQSKVKRQARG